MARGPLPNKDSRRRNKPTIPTTKLPVSGRKGRPPALPKAYNLRKPGTEWWKWFWSTPQAMAVDKGALYVIARRAQLEDDLDLMDRGFEAKELAELLGIDENDQIRELEFVVGRLGAMAGGRNPILKEMRELDKVLGLTPKAMADLRWEIVADEEADPKQATSSKSSGAGKKPPKAKDGDRRARLSLVASQ
jgi:hypothetical protein